ncbi:Conserved_hypothetical protein [Hexamita inflata]|uniref:Uncharacterized protein n=1 Tax=Hexamita inflata TaxID=28002 RepID=A0AA86UJA4_9EUKA|nr:Conserved hypothetical protein [Hexamita inflata]
MQPLSRISMTQSTISDNQLYDADLNDNTTDSPQISLLKQKIQQLRQKTEQLKGQELNKNDFATRDILKYKRQQLQATPPIVLASPAVNNNQTFKVSQLNSFQHLDKSTEEQKMEVPEFLRSSQSKSVQQQSTAASINQSQIKKLAHKFPKKVMSAQPSVKPSTMGVKHFLKLTKDYDKSTQKTYAAIVTKPDIQPPEPIYRRQTATELLSKFDIPDDIQPKNYKQLKVNQLDEVSDEFDSLYKVNKQPDVLTFDDHLKQLSAKLSELVLPELPHHYQRTDYVQIISKISRKAKYYIRQISNTVPLHDYIKQACTEADENINAVAELIQKQMRLNNQFLNFISSVFDVESMLVKLYRASGTYDEFKLAVEEGDARRMQIVIPILEDAIEAVVEDLNPIKNQCIKESEEFVGKMVVWFEQQPEGEDVSGIIEDAMKEEETFQITVGQKKKKTELLGLIDQQNKKRATTLKMMK